jgi:acyl-CoA thioesterase I
MSMFRSIFIRATTAACAMLLMIGCEGVERNAAERVAVPPTASDGEAGPERGTVLFVGTSLTAGYGLPTEESFPERIQEKIDSAGLPFRTVNAGVSGETSAGARRRIEWLLNQPFDVLVLETGANDMLRGMDLDTTQANIEAIVDRVRRDRPDVPIVLAGMLAPPNLGREYTTRFAQMYEEVARERDLMLIPFLLRDVGGVRPLNLADGIHPNADGQRIVAQTVWAELEPVLRERAAAR